MQGGTQWNAHQPANGQQLGGNQYAYNMPNAQGPYPPAPAGNEYDQGYQQQASHQTGGYGGQQAAWNSQPRQEVIHPPATPTATVEQPRMWTGTVTEIIPPNYGIVDSNAFYVHDVVIGRIPGVGEQVRCEAIPNTDGGKYMWRLVRVTTLQEVPSSYGNTPARPVAAARPGPPPRQNERVEPQQYPIRGPVQGSYGQASTMYDSRMGAGTGAMRSAPVRSGRDTHDPTRGPGTQSTLPSRRSDYSVAGPTEASGRRGAGQDSRDSRSQLPSRDRRDRDPRPDRHPLRDRPARPAARDRVRSRSPVKRLAGASDRSPPPRLRPPSSRYTVRLPLAVIHTRERGLHDLAHRHKDLYIPSEYMQSISHWLDLMASDEPIKLSSPVLFKVFTPPKPTKSEEPADKADTREKETKEGDAVPPAVDTPPAKSDTAAADPPGDAVPPVAEAVKSPGEDETPVPMDEDPPIEVPVPDVPDSKNKGKKGGKKVTAKAGTAAAAVADGSASEPVRGRAGRGRAGKVTPTPTKKGTRGSTRRSKAGEEAEVEAESVEPMDETTTAEPVAPVLPSPQNGIAASEVTLQGGTPKKVEKVEKDDDIASGMCWSAKVLIMGGVHESSLLSESDKHFVHPVNATFLIGKRPRGELLLLGGRWDPQDGAHPAKDPLSLVRTAVRTVKEATTIDLASCCEWTKLLELQFRRQASATGLDHTHVEKTIVFLVPASAVASPNVAGLAELQAAKDAPERETVAKTKLKEAENLVSEADALLKVLAETSTAAAAANEANEKRLPNAKDMVISELDGMTVSDLQAEMTNRGLNTQWDPLKGKEVLVARLQAHVQKQHAVQAAHKAAVDSLNVHNAHILKLQVDFQLCQSEYKAAQEAAKAAYTLQDKPPAPLVLDCQGKHENDTVKALTLDQLLDYGPSDTKETTFEVSMAAEAVVEILQMHFGRVLAAALSPIATAEAKVAAAEKAADEAKRLEREEQRRLRDAEKAEKAAKKTDPGTKAATGVDSKDGVVSSSASASAEGVTEKPGDAAPKKDDGTKQDEVADAVAKGATAAEKGSVDASKDSKEMKETKESKDSRDKVQDLRKKRGLDSDAPVDVKRVKTEASQSVGKDTVQLAARFFDENLTGYIEDTDLEDIIHLTHWSTSRRWVQDMVEAATRRGRLRYSDYPQLKVNAQVGIPTLVDTELDTVMTPPTDSSNGIVTIQGLTVDVPAVCAALETTRNQLHSLQGSTASQQNEVDQMKQEYDLKNLRNTERMVAMERKLEASQEAAKAAYAEATQLRNAATSSASQVTKVNTEVQAIKGLLATALSKAGVIESTLASE